MKTKIKLTAYTQPGCPPCIDMKKNKTLESLGNCCTIKKIDINKMKESEIDRLGLKGTPTIIIEKDGKTKRLVGGYSTKELQKEISNL